MKKLDFSRQDKTYYSVLLFFLLLISDIIAAVAGFGGALFTTMFFEGQMIYSFESLAVSVCFIFFVLFIILYSYRNNQPKKLLAVGLFNLLMSAAFIICNSVYYPFAYLISDAVCVLFDATDILYFSFFDMLLSELVSVPLTVISFILFFILKKNNGRKAEGKASMRVCSLIISAVLLLVASVCYYICNTPVSEYFNYSFINDAFKEISYENNANEIFDSITADTSFYEAHIMLKEKGFVSDREVYENSIITDEMKIVYVAPGNDRGFDKEHITLVSTTDGKVKSKKKAKSSSVYLYSQEITKTETEKAKEAFEQLHIGDDKISAVNKMENVAEVFSYYIEYGENTITEEYNFFAYKNLGFGHRVDYTNFDAVVVFENDILKEGSYNYSNYSNANSENTVCNSYDYSITD